MKKIEKEYIDNMNSSLPDMDKLWQQVTSEAAKENMSADNDITPFEAAAEYCGRQRTRSATVLRRFAVAAALIAIMISSVIGIAGSDFFKESVISENSADIAADSGNHTAAVSGWEYRTECSDAASYEVLRLERTEDAVYTAVPADPIQEGEYFVEDDVLEKTDFFVDCKILSSVSDEERIMYTAQVVHLIGDVSAAAEISFSSESAYALRQGREYLLPIQDSGGEYSLAYNCAPQIEISLDRDIICHNGWKTLKGRSIEYPQVYYDDYFYDRMNITAECSLGELFGKWEKLRS